MTMMNSGNTGGGAGGWHVGRVAGQCAACGTELPRGATCWAALCDAPIEQLSAAEKAAVIEGAREEGEGGKGRGVAFCAGGFL